MDRYAILCSIALLIVPLQALAQSAEVDLEPERVERAECGLRLWIAGAALLPSGVILESLTIVGALMAPVPAGRIAAEVGFVVGLSAVIVGIVALAVGLTRRRRCPLARASPSPPEWSLLATDIHLTAGHRSPFGG